MITTQEVKKIAHLSRLSFKDEEILSLTKQISGIMQMIDVLNEVNCDGVEPLTSVCDMNQRMRADEVTDSNICDELFSNAPGESAKFAKEIKCFVVPKVME